MRGRCACGYVSDCVNMSYCSGHGSATHCDVSLVKRNIMKTGVHFLVLLFLSYTTLEDNNQKKNYHYF